VARGGDSPVTRDRGSTGPALILYGGPQVGEAAHASVYVK
jgi:hypothetical protein